MAALIRNAQPGDEQLIGDFAVRLFDQHVGYDAKRFSAFANVDGAARFYRSRFETPDSVVLVAEVDGEVVGFAYLERDDLNYAGLLEKGAWLHDIYVDEATRAEGVGKSLITAAAKAAKRMGAEKLLLTVAAKNFAAQKVFEKAGFRPTMVEMTLNLPEIS